MCLQSTPIKTVCVTVMAVLLLQTGVGLLSSKMNKVEQKFRLILTQRFGSPSKMADAETHPDFTPTWMHGYEYLVEN